MVRAGLIWFEVVPSYNRAIIYATGLIPKTTL
jgi:hypothetical protein